MKKITTNPENPLFMRLYRFVIIIIYGHANASLLINMGVPVKVISEHLGHRDTRTTETIYAHVFAETMVQASNAISEALSTVES